MHLRPIDRRNDAVGEQRYVEAKFSSRDVDQFLAVSEEIQQQRAETRMLKHLCHRAVARAVPAASASVRKEDKSVRIGRQTEVAVEGDTSRIEAHGAWCCRLGCDAHDGDLI